MIFLQVDAKNGTNLSKEAKVLQICIVRVNQVERRVVIVGVDLKIFIVNQVVRDTL